MPEQRTDWLTGRTVLIAEDRALRPNEFDANEPPPVGKQTESAASCPFCPGHESITPPAAYERLDDSGRWCVRVVPNKYPAVMLPASLGVASAANNHARPPRKSNTSSVAAVGAHEVIIETARHVDRSSSLSVIELQYVLEAYANRLRNWRAAGEFGYGLVFKNQGAPAGASIAHLHGQLVALPTVPPTVEAELHRATLAFTETRSCPYCVLVDRERSQRSRVVIERDGFFAFCPFASIQPHEVWLMPINHEPSFEQAANAETLPRLAAVLHALIARLEPAISTASFNLLVRTSPWKLDSGSWFHWRIELIPRVNSIAGFELATGTYINSLAPEHAAANLRAR